MSQVIQAALEGGKVKEKDCPLAPPEEMQFC